MDGLCWLAPAVFVITNMNESCKQDVWEWVEEADLVFNFIHFSAFPSANYCTRLFSLLIKFAFYLFIFFNLHFKK